MKKIAFYVAFILIVVIAVAACPRKEPKPVIEDLNLYEKIGNIGLDCVKKIPANGEEVTASNVVIAPDTKYAAIITSDNMIGKIKIAGMSDFKKYKEIMIPVRIACTKEQIIQIAKFTIEHYKQKAVFVTLVSENTMVFYADGEAPEPNDE